MLTLKAVRHTRLTCFCRRDMEGREEEEAGEEGKHIRVDSEKVSNWILHPRESSLNEVF